MSYNSKNYTEQGGEKTVIGGTLEIAEGASVTGLSADPLLVATEETLGGVKAAAAGESDTVEVKIGEDGKLYVQALAAATSEALGGVIAEEATVGDTVEVKIGEDGKLYIPAYPTDATDSVSGLVKIAANQADSIAEDTAALVTDFNALLAKLKAAGLMAADEE
jgi:antitoxin component of MazEF toxin-antitoxin module